MIINAYAIRDKKALTYAPPYFQATDGLAVRVFGDLCNDRNTTVGRHPSDFSLFRVGAYNDASGMLIPIDPEFVIEALSLVADQAQLPLAAE